MTRLLVLAILLLGGPPVALAQEGGVFAGGSAPPAPNVDVNVDLGNPGTAVNFETFEQGLAPYGDWVTVPRYGRAFRPRAAAGWRPYYYGRWEWTDEGWLWVSDEPWGWATYHYGRWAYDSDDGWIWVPGYQWAPAWVTWRYSPDYIGWAPLAPGFSVYVTNYPVRYGWWCFVPYSRFVGYPVHTVAYSSVYVQSLYRVTLPAPPRSVAFGVAAPAWGGPARPLLERRLGRPISPVRLEAVASPGALAGPARPGVVMIYRPETRIAPGPPRLPGGAVAPARPGEPPRWVPPGPPRPGLPYGGRGKPGVGGGRRGGPHRR
jgi:hypothetical protein